jgi:hypothetical protein
VSREHLIRKAKHPQKKDHVWYYETASGIEVFHEQLDRSVDKFTISLASIRAYLRRLDRKPAKGKR